MHNTLSEHDAFYCQAALYDLAFSYRDYPAELDFILAAVKQLGKQPESVLELASGPGRHALAAAGKGLRALALDNAEAMVAYGQRLAADAGLTVTYLQGDMRNFELSEPVDLALMMLDSASYLHTQDDFLSHLKAVACALTAEGVYLLELSHPKDLFSAEQTTSTDWEMASGDTKVHLQWGAPEDVFDPITQLTRVSVLLRAETPEGPVKITDSAAQRCYSYPEICALIRLQGDFRLAASYGAFDPEISLEHAKAWRMILLLERC